MKKYIQFIKGKQNRAFLFLLIIMCIISLYPVSALANGWVDKNHSTQIYGSASSSSSTEDTEELEEMHAVEKYFVQTIVRDCDIILYFFKNQTIPLSIDGIVLGRLAYGIDVSYTKFELAPNNPWGVMGAIVYKTLAVSILGFFLLSFLINLIKYMFNSNSGKERATFKEYIYNFIFWFFILFAGYILIDWLLYVIDVFIFSLQKHFLSTMNVDTSTSVSLIKVFREEANTGIINALMYLAAVFSGLFFLSNYVGTAIIQTGGFSVMPAICLKATNNKRAFTTWSEIFIMNLFIPLIDSVLLLMPSGFYEIVKAAAGQDAANSFSVTLVRLLIVWAIIPSRNIILRMIGGGNVPVNGMRGLAYMALMAARTLGRGGGALRKTSGVSGDTGHETFKGDMEKSRQAQMQADVFADAHNAATVGMSDIDNLLSSGGRATGDIGGSAGYSTAESGFSGGGSSEDELNEMLSSGSSSADEQDSSLRDGFDSGFNDGDGENAIPVDEIDTETMGGMDMIEPELSDDADVEGYEGDVIASAGMQRGDMAEDIPEDISETMPERTSDDIQTNYDGLDGVRDMSGESLYDESTVGQTDNVAAMSSELEGNFGEPDEMQPADMEDVSPYQNIPNMDSDFARTLEGADLDRYANLSARDALKEQMDGNNERLNEINEEMADNSAAMTSITRENNELSGANEEITARNGLLNNEISSLQSRNMELDAAIAGGNIDRGTAELEKARNNAVIAEKSEELSRNNAILSHNRERIEANNRDLGALETKEHGYHAESARIRSNNQKLQKGIENCTAREHQYADNYATAGMERKNYQDARAFQIDKSGIQKMQTNVNYRNFDKGDFEKNLSPEQRAKYYRERAVKGTVSRTVTTAAGAVGAVGAAGAVGAVGAAAMAFGGPEAAMVGAGVGAGVGAKVGTKAGTNAATATVKVASVGGKVAAGAVRKAAPKVKNAVSSALNSNERPKKNVAENKKTTTKASQTQKTQPGTTKAGHGGDRGEDLRETYRKEVEEMNRQFEKSTAQGSKGEE